MAPSRKKGHSKAAAAAAASRQWKVGDLVLAKVKGFPAWPATVSEPEKWGYSADWKKVLVYFFGTQQIAFCNPADVEAFTEEKKESLLIKRHGKGADFVRALHEIIDSYEKLKKQDQGIIVHSTDEITVTNASKSVESIVDSGLKDEAPAATVKSCPKSSQSARDKSDQGFPIETAAATTQKDALHDREMPSEYPTGNLVVTKMPLPTTYSRKKLGRMQAQNFVTQKRAPSARRSRSSSRVDSSRFQNLMFPSSNSSLSAGNLASSVLRNGSSRRNKRVRKSPDVSEGNDMDSLAFVSNGSPEENGSEIVTVDSDTVSFNEGSTVESGYDLLQPESVVEGCEGDVELKQGLDFQVKAVVVKKKRKPSRKRASNGDNELTGRLDKEAGLENELHKNRKISPSDIEKSNGRYSKDDGDEHLPLVKRARVRMGRPSSTEEELDTLVQPQEKSSEAPNSCLGRVCTASNCEENSPIDINSFVVRDVDNSSPSNKLPMNQSPLWEVNKHQELPTSPSKKGPMNEPPLCEVKKSQQLGCSVDGEAALPPSKRLHRALEAMSAYAAEDGQTSVEAQSTMKTFSNGCFSFTRDHTDFSMENKARSEFQAQNVDSFSCNASQDCISGFAPNFNPAVGEESTKSFVQVAACDQTGKSSKSPEHVFCKDILVEAVDCADGRNPSVPSLSTHTAENMVIAQSLKPLSPHLGKKQARLRCNQGLAGLMLPSYDDSKIENSELSEPCKEDDPSEHSRTSSDPLSGGVGITICSQQNYTNLPPYGAQDNCETTKLLNLPSDENNPDNGMCEIVKENTPTLKDSNASPSPTTKEVMMAAVQGPHLSHSTPLSEDHLSHKAVSGIRSCSSPTEGLDSTAHASPHNTSICNLSTSDNSNFLENNGCCSSDVHLHHEKPKHDGKLSNRTEANAALTSFEAIIGALTRTKESIGRATRIAIDCAKFGIASKVVEILARNLETEPSLHRRVDLFFLVDSITQCSRGLKGDVGGIYPSAIQSVLPRLLLAAAPPGSSAQENRRQCLKVLRLWQDRKILPESIIRRHIRELDSLSNLSTTSAFSRRPLRTERAFDDPLREMEGMVDEYGSNSSFQLPGFRMPPMLKDEDEGSDSDGESFEAVTPEHNSENPEERGRAPIAAIEMRRHILEDVDGELEMEDVAPSCAAEMSSTSNVAEVNTAKTLPTQFEQHFPLPFAPPLPKDVPPLSPPLPTSPPPPPPPPPPPSVPHPSTMPDPIANGFDSKLHLGLHNIKDDSQQPIAQQSVAPRINPTISDAVHYQAPEDRDSHMPMQMPESANTCSFSSLPVSHPPLRAVNGGQQVDGATLHKSFHLRPPHPAQSNQFSYVQADQRVQPRMDIPPQSYPNRPHFVHSTDSGNFYSDHDRMKLAPHDIRESWRFSAPSLSGPCYPDNSRVSYAPVPYAGPPSEPPMPNHSWAFPPRATNHRELMPHRTPSEGPIPVAVRAPNFWRPR